MIIQYINKYFRSKYNIGFLLFGVHISVCFGQESVEAPSWVDFCTKTKNGEMDKSVLLDYSYAGYHFSEKEIPDVSLWNAISVVEYGANPNDDVFDDEGIQAAIDAAEETGIPTVVFFPAGKYLVGSESTKNTPIEINKSHIVLKGAGNDSGGTEIYAVNFGDTTKKWDTPWRFRFIAQNSPSSVLTKIIKNIKRGDKTIEVADGSKVKVGMLLKIDHLGKENLELNLPGLQFNPKWTTIIEEGIRVHEKHLVTKVEGNKVTLKNPVNYNIPIHGDYSVIKLYTPIEEVGVEDILFTSAWKQYPENYVHHANDIVDYAWRAIYFEKVYNGWIQNVKFRDWNDCIQFNDGFAITVKNVEISGKQGHASFMADGCTGVLFENCKDLVPIGFNDAGGQGHGPALQGYSTGCVYKNIEMQRNQSIDCHGYAPYGNLFDNVYGGCFRGNGGAEKAYPNSGPDLVFWNFVHVSNFTTYEFDFWQIKKRVLHNYARPKFIGFTSPNENITFKNEGLDELHGIQVYPNSLFDAQLQLRLYNVYASASSQKDYCGAKNVLNNNNEDYWSPSGKSAGSYLLLDFGTEKDFKNVLLNDKNNAITKFKLECWIDGKWVIKTVKPTKKVNIYTFDRVIKTRKVKLIIEEVNKEKKIQITEFNVL